MGTSTCGENSAKHTDNSLADVKVKRSNAPVLLKGPVRVPHASYSEGRDSGASVLQLRLSRVSLCHSELRKGTSTQRIPY